MILFIFCFFVSYLTTCQLTICQLIDWLWCETWIHWWSPELWDLIVCTRLELYYDFMYRIIILCFSCLATWLPFLNKPTDWLIELSSIDLIGTAHCWWPWVTFSQRSCDRVYVHALIGTAHCWWPWVTFSQRSCDRVYVHALIGAAHCWWPWVTFSQRSCDRVYVHALRMRSQHVQQHKWLHY